MSRQLNITEARNQFLSFPEKLAPGESVDIVRRKKRVLRVVRVGEESIPANPFDLMDQVLSRLPKPRKKPPRDLSSNLKHYLYGKKK